MRTLILPALGLLLLAGCSSAPGPSGNDPGGFYSAVCPTGTFSQGPLYPRRTYGYRSPYGRYRDYYDYSRPYYYCRPYVAVGRSAMTLLITSSEPGVGNSFSGSGVQYPNGHGTVDFHNLSDTDCAGELAYVTWRRAEGSVQCADGRSGTFYFSHDSLNGTGSVTLGSRSFRFTLVVT